MRFWFDRIHVLSTISGLKTSPHLGNSVLLGVCSGHSGVSVKGLNGSRRTMLSSAQLQSSQLLTELEEEMVEAKEERKFLGHGKARCNVLNTTGESELVEQMAASLSVDMERSKGKMRPTITKLVTSWLPSFLIVVARISLLRCTMNGILG